MWHNYGFDRHVLGNHVDEGLRIDCKGFESDTMHLARLWNSSRQGKGYSLESLSTDVDIIMREMGADMQRFDHLGGGDEGFEGKISMRTLFGQKATRNDGTPGKLARASLRSASAVSAVAGADALCHSLRSIMSAALLGSEAARLLAAQVKLPGVRELQSTDDPARRKEWIKYSAKDAVATWLLRRTLEAKLRSMKVQACEFVGRGQEEALPPSKWWCANMWQLYQRYWKPFGQLLTQMEVEGMYVCRNSLKAAEQSAREHQRTSMRQFRDWVGERMRALDIDQNALQPDSELRPENLMNVGSGLQARCGCLCARRIVTARTLRESALWPKLTAACAGPRSGCCSSRIPPPPPRLRRPPRLPPKRRRRLRVSQRPAQLAVRPAAVAQTRNCLLPSRDQQLRRLRPRRARRRRATTRLRQRRFHCRGRSSKQRTLSGGGGTTTRRGALR